MQQPVVEVSTGLVLQVHNFYVLSVCDRSIKSKVFSLHIVSTRETSAMSFNKTLYLPPVTIKLNN